MVYKKTYENIVHGTIITSYTLVIISHSFHLKGHFGAVTTAPHGNHMAAYAAGDLVALVVRSVTQDILDEAK